MPNSTTSSQGPTSKKRKVNRSGLDGNPLSKDLQLRALKVSQVTLNRYLHSIQVFEQWCSEHRHVSQRASLDSRVNAYLAHLYEEDAEITVASYLIYGLQLLRCKIPKEQFLVESKQSLAGWRRQSPGKMRIPVPEEFVYDLATLALEQRKLDLAMLLVIQLDGYLRPSEAWTLTVQHLNRPQGKRYPHWSLFIAPSTLGETTKTCKSDDSILLGDHSQNRWIRECLRLWSQTKTDRLFPDITLNAYERWCPTWSGMQLLATTAITSVALCWRYKNAEDGKQRRLCLAMRNMRSCFPPGGKRLIDDGRPSRPDLRSL